MSTVTVTTTPTVLDAGTAYDLSLVNSGSLNIQVTVNGGSVGNLFSQILRPGQQVTVYPHGYPVSAFTASGTSSVDVTLGNNPQLNASREATQDALGAGALVKTANLSDLANPGTARTNLGLGTAATHPDTDFLTPSAASATFQSGLKSVVASAGAAQALNLATAAVFDLTLTGSTFSDGVSTSGSATFTSASAAFTSADNGLAIRGSSIAGLNNIDSNGVTNGTTVTLRTPGRWSATGVSFALNRPCVLTVTGANVTGKAAHMRVVLRQDQHAGRTVTWFAGIVWPGGTAPELSCTPGAVDTFDFISTDGGTTWEAQPTGSLAARKLDASRIRAGATVAFLGDSLTVQDAGSLDGTYLVSAATAGDTTIVVADNPAGAAQISWDIRSIALDPGSNVEWYVNNSWAATGSGPYTITLPAALDHNHPAGALMVMRGMGPAASTWPLTACAVSGQVARYGGVFGHAGFSPEQIRDWYLPQLILSAPDAAVILAGHNGLTGGNLAYQVGVIVQIWERLLAHGIQPIHCTQLPDDGLGANQYKLEQLNMLLSEAARVRGIPQIDLHAAATDPATGLYRVGYTSDGTHPSGKGSDALATAVSTFLTSYFPNSTVALVDQPTLNNGGGLTLWPSNPTNALMQTSTGSGNNVRANGYNTAGCDGVVGLGELIAAPDGVGQANRITRLAQSTNSTVEIDDPGYTLIPGHLYELAVKIATTGVNAAWDASRTITAPNKENILNGWQGIEMTVSNGSTGSMPLIKQWRRDITGTLYARFVVPKGLTSNSVNIKTFLTGVSATALPQMTLTFWRVTFKDLTAAGVAMPALL